MTKGNERLDQFKDDIEEHGGSGEQGGGYTNATKSLITYLELNAPVASELPVRERARIYGELEKFKRTLQRQLEGMKKTEEVTRAILKDNKSKRSVIKSRGKSLTLSRKAMGGLKAEARAAEDLLDTRKLDRDLELIEELLPLFETRHARV